MNAQSKRRSAKEDRKNREIQAQQRARARRQSSTGARTESSPDESTPIGGTSPKKLRHLSLITLLGLAMITTTGFLWGLHLWQTPSPIQVDANRDSPEIYVTFSRAPTAGSQLFEQIGKCTARQSSWCPPGGIKMTLQVGAAYAEKLPQGTQVDFTLRIGSEGGPNSPPGRFHLNCPTSTLAVDGECLFVGRYFPERPVNRSSSAPAIVDRKQLGLPVPSSFGQSPLFALAWRPDELFGLTNSFLSVVFPAVVITGQGQLSSSGSPNDCQRALTLPNNALANYSVIAGKGPDTILSKAWSWDNVAEHVGQCPDLTVSAQNIDAVQEQNRTNFLAGIFLGVAGAAAIAGVVEILRALDARRGEGRKIWIFGRLIGVPEMAPLLGMTAHQMQKFTEEDCFPKPVPAVVRDRVWRRGDIKKWAKDTGRRWVKRRERRRAAV
jgi:predicted DNA-binding transcriptional regulator AlpA